MAICGVSNLRLGVWIQDVVVDELDVVFGERVSGHLGGLGARFFLEWGWSDFARC